MTDDIELLRRYADQASEEAFAELVRRNVDFVYATALRQTRNPERAKDVTQAVFAALARKARGLAQRTDLVGWLYLSTHYAATDLVRKETRRARREREVEVSHDTAADPGATTDWQALHGILDDALRDLSDTDRVAILLRFFKNRTFAELGAALHLTENAARKRVDRALVKLQPLLARRGVVSTTAALAMAMASEAGMAAPAGLTAAITGPAIAAAAAATTGATAAVLHLMSTTKTVGTVATLVALLAIVSAGYQFKAARNSTARLSAVTRERDALQSQAAAARKRTALSGNGAAATPPVVPGTQSPVELPWGAPSPVDYVFAHPEARAAFVQQEVQRAKAKFDRFFRASGLSAADQERFLAQLTGWAQAKLDLATDLAAQGYGPRNPPQDPQAYMKLFEVDAQVDHEYLTNLKALLGESTFQQFTDYRKTIPEFNVAAQLASQLYDTDAALTPQQAGQLVQTIRENPYSARPVPSPANTMGGAPVAKGAISDAQGQSNLANGDNMMPNIDWTAPVTDAAYAQARSFLTPTQLSALRELQARQAALYELAPPAPAQPDIQALLRVRDGSK